MEDIKLEDIKKTENFKKPGNAGKNGIIRVSPLGKTWILDLDGTIVKHNGYILDGEDSFLPGAREFLDSIPDTDMIVFLTSRKDELQEGEEKSNKEMTEEFLKKHNVRYDRIIYNAPYGERILINDSKPSGLPMAYALNPKRDELFGERFEVDETL